MKSLNRLIKSEDGVVMVTVVIIVLVMMIVTISILSMTTNQTILMEKESKRIQAEMMGQKVLHYLYADQLQAIPTEEYLPTDGAFTINAVLDSSNPGIISPIDIEVSY